MAHPTAPSSAVIIWLASYPRSGNTFLRLVLHRLYGIRTSTVYDVDGVAERLGADFIGSEAPTATIETMRAVETIHLVKTHRQRDGQVAESDRAICLIRDGRDALVSYARLRTEGDASQFATELSTLIDCDDDEGTGGWGRNVLSWQCPPVRHRIRLRFDDLVRDPRSAVVPAMAAVLPGVAPRRRVPIPAFADLHATDSGFFRSGTTGSYRRDLPVEMHERFWSNAANREAMELVLDS